jgi:hypothetical protein
VLQARGAAGGQRAGRRADAPRSRRGGRVRLVVGRPCGDERRRLGPVGSSARRVQPPRTVGHEVRFLTDSPVKQPNRKPEKLDRAVPQLGAGEHPNRPKRGLRWDVSPPCSRSCGVAFISRFGRSVLKPSSPWATIQHGHGPRAEPGRVLFTILRRCVYQPVWAERAETFVTMGKPIQHGRPRAEPGRVLFTIL